MPITLTDIVFLWPALVAGLLLSLMMGPLGSIVLWRRMTFLGDALGHSSVLGLAIGTLLQFSLGWSVFISCCVILLLLPFFERFKQTNDALLGVMSHSFLAFGFVLIYWFQPKQNIESFLFGDMLNIVPVDVIKVGGVVFLGAVLLYCFWQAWVLMSVHPELAKAEKLATAKSELVFNLFLAMIVAVSIQFLGVLLISALLVIPAATARFIAKTPEEMAWRSAGLGAIAVILGLFIALRLDLPLAPALVAVMGTQFILISGTHFLSAKMR
jgi:zinc transport system permease protein